MHPQNPSGANEETGLPLGQASPVRRAAVATDFVEGRYPLSAIRRRDCNSLQARSNSDAIDIYKIRYKLSRFYLGFPGGLTIPACAGSAGAQLAAVRDFSSPRRCTRRYCSGLRRPLFIYPPTLIQSGPRCPRFAGQFYFSAKSFLYVKSEKIDSPHPFGSQDPVVPIELGEIRSPQAGQATLPAASTGEHLPCTYPVPTLY
jgi:hypothetical protein